MAPTQQQQQHTPSTSVDSNSIRDNSITSSCCNSNRSTNNGSSTTNRYHSSSNSISCNSSSSSSSTSISSSTSNSSNGTNSITNNSANNNANSITNNSINSMTNRLREADSGLVQTSGDGDHLLLPISCRGQFYHDAFFTEARQHFEAAVRDVLDHWGQRSALGDDLTCYRKLRESDLTESSQAVTVTQDNNSHQVVMDVRDFLSGDVKVKVVDEDELVVEGSVEQRQEGSVSKKSFRRRFSFPGLVRPEAVTSTMSSDGVLTVIVPKKETVIPKAGLDTNKVSSLTHSRESDVTLGNSNSFCNTATLNTTSSRILNANRNKNYKTELTVQLAGENEVKKASTDETTKSDDKHVVVTHSNDFSDFLLPISRKGLFFHDSFFEEARKDFEAAVKKVVETWGESRVSDDMTCYRSLRERNLQEENQAVSLTEDHQSHKVVMDVRDFLSGDVKVKVVDEDELVVEGSVEQRQEGSVSKKSFRRRFSFPGLVRPEAITSTMSSDGVLTVIVPKKERLSHTKEINLREVNLTDNSSTRTTLENSNICINDAAVHMNHESSKVSKSSEDTECQTKKSTKLNVNSELTKQSTDDTTRTSRSDKTQFSSSLAPDFLLPISRKGLFFHDSFFEEARKDFEAAVKKVVETWGESRVSDDMTCYRSLRERNLQEENQAVSLTEDHQSHKVVMDVRDFLSGDVKVKMVDEDELVVEGSVEQRQEGSVSKKSFRRRFSFPGLVRPEAITSTMSSDGVLTVIVPKKEPSSTTESSDTVKDVTITSTQQTAGKELSSSLTNISRNVKQSSSVETLASSLEDEKVVTQKINQKSSNNRGTTRLSSSSVTEDIGVDKTFSQEQTQNEGSTANEETWGLDPFLPICHKGLFFHDSFFQDVRQDFETAVQEVLTKFGEVSSSSDDLSLYRSLRECDLRDENQAVKVTENQHGHQVVIDVGDFMKGNVMVRVVGEGEVEAEGQVEKQEGNSRSSKSFCRRFTLPGVVDMNDINAAVSSDGVLTITATKASGRRASRVMRTGQEQTSEMAAAVNEESCHEESKEWRKGSSTQVYSNTHTSQQRLVSSSRSRQ